MKHLVFWSTVTLALAGAAGQQTVPSAPQSSAGGQIIYQRSADSSAAANLTGSGSDSSVHSEITDADRLAVTFTRYALDVRLHPEAAADQPTLSVRAQISIRNDGNQPLRQVPLQLSSTLNWEEIRLIDATRLVRCHFAQAALDSDSDHTGKLNEAAIVLSQALAPGATLAFDVIYSGRIPLSAQRLQAIDTPADVALHSDWDQLVPGFVGLRGFGNVAWYPVSSVPIRLGDGDRLFEEIGRIKLRQAAATMSMKVTEETRDSVPNVAVLNGSTVPLTIAAGTEQANIPSLLSGNLPAAPLGFQTPSLFLASRTHSSGSGADVYARPENNAAAAIYLSSISMVAPLVRTWLGDRPKSSLSILDLASNEDAPFEERQTLYAGLQPAAADQLTGPLAHVLAHAYFEAGRPWLHEGVAQFVATLWTEQSRSRAAAIEQLNGQRSALALAEPDAPSTTELPGLLRTSNPIFYRTKAAYVLWMLRSILGDGVMQAILKAYDPAADTTDDYFEQLVVRFARTSAPGTSNGREKTDDGEAFAKDLHTFFVDWVYYDRGLPDLAISGVYTSKASAPNSYLVAVNVTNSGSAVAWVPVTLTSGTTQVTERMVVPAHGTTVRRILIQDEPVQVQVNDGTVPETEASEHVERIHYTQSATP